MKASIAWPLAVLVPPAVIMLFDGFGLSMRDTLLLLWALGAIAALVGGIAFDASTGKRFPK